VLKTLQRLHDFIRGTVSHTQRLVSTAGGCVSSDAILAVSNHTTGAPGTLLIVPSMGASAVLLFAVPHGLRSTGVTTRHEFAHRTRYETEALGKYWKRID
jgi:hypothetical protein